MKPPSPPFGGPSSTKSTFPAVTLARHAMATRFELVLPGANTADLHSLGEEVLDDIERWESQLSPFRPHSEISRINACAEREPVRVSPPVYALLQRARKLHLASQGAFDITIAPLLRAWGFSGEPGALPSATTLAAVRDRTGMQHLEWDDDERTIRFRRPGMGLDLGAIGKGFAIDRAISLLQDAGIHRALIHGGTSSVYGLGAPPGDTAWKVAIALPPANAGGRPLRLSTVPLRDASLGVSAIWGKSLSIEGRNYGHVLNPGTGQPAEAACLAAVALPSATESDALSTALLVAGAAGLDWLRTAQPAAKALVVARQPGAVPYRVWSEGLEIASGLSHG